jgi:tryptophanyl-tRNA synthetase
VKTVLTGITTTGAPHIGNYVGAIRPSVTASMDPERSSYFFLADYHSLVKGSDPDAIARSTLEIAASWLAAGLDPEKVVLYRQSDVPEIPELAWILTCMTAKGLMNRAHAYKAAVAENESARDADPDKGITMGLYSYPILMAADILMFNAHTVPVGRDQKQHVEMARDIAARFNHHYGETFVLPEYERLIAAPDYVEETLVAGGSKAREFSMPFLRKIRHNVGIRSLVGAGN